MQSEQRLPRIAIPVPHSGDQEYAERALPPYLDAVRGAGGDPVRIELGLTALEILRQIEDCDGILLPGSRADVDPEKYQTERDPKTAAADSKREAVHRSRRGNADVPVPDSTRKILNCCLCST